MIIKKEKSAHTVVATSTERRDLVGVVLAGGRSQRMGRDKSLIDYHGLPQREFAFNLLRHFCNSVHLSCRNANGIPVHLNPVEDQFDFSSPLNGILSVWSIAPRMALLTLPVDMPWVDRQMIEELMDGRNPEKMATCFFDSDGSRPEPLLCIWESKSYEQLMAFARDGHISPREFLMSHDVSIVHASSPALLRNVNTPQDMPDKS